jgi:hypothetical protein
MKKMMIVLMIFSGGFLFASKDTNFRVEDIEPKNTINIDIPYSVYNTKATSKQNAQAWYYHKKPIISISKEIKYEWFTRKSTLITKTLEFNGVRNVFVEKGETPVESKPYELIVILFISFLTTSFLQRCVYKKNFLQAKYLSYFILVLVVICTSLFANNFIKPICIVFWVLAFSLIVGINITNEHRSMLVKRNTFLLISVFFSGLIVFLLFSDYIIVYIYYVIGIILGLLTIYYWKYRRAKKLLKKNINL